MSKETTFTVKTTVTKTKGSIMDKFDVVVEGSGFTGTSEDQFSLGSAFEKAYQDLMMKVSEGIFSETDRR
jgi:hypothetical protein